MKTSQKFASPRRRAMTLIEIMAAILVLSIGLVGVLAAIPFGGFRMAQMREADNAAAVGRNAIRMMKANGWANPKEWEWFSRSRISPPYVCSTNYWNMNGEGDYGLAYPFFVDPIGKMGAGERRYQPEESSLTPAGRPTTTITRVYPQLVPYGTKFSLGTFDDDFRVNGAALTLLNSLTSATAKREERAFYLQDDVFYGYGQEEDESEFRPSLEMELDAVLSSGDIPAFSGRYSWMATVALRSKGDDPSYAASAYDVSSADFDVVVFKDRIPGDERAFAATVDGSGYQGGSVVVDLTTEVSPNSNNPADAERVVDQLATTRHIMLVGPGDVGDGRFFAKWYQIANFSVSATDANGVPTELRLTTIGPNAPSGWGNGGSAVTALFFPGVVGVYSSTTTFDVD